MLSYSKITRNSEDMGPLIIVNQYADFADVLYFLFNVFLSSLQPEWHPALLLSQCFLNLAAHSHLQPRLNVPQTCTVYLLCVHVQASVYMCGPLCATYCMYICGGVCVCIYVSETVDQQLLETLCCTVCYCHGFLRSPPEREAKCPLSRIAVHFHE